MTIKQILIDRRPAILRIASNHGAHNVSIFRSFVSKKSCLSIKEHPHVQTQ